MDPLATAMAQAAVPLGDPNAVAVNWNLFQGAFAAIDQPLQNAVDAINGQLLGSVNPLLKVALLLWLSLQLTMMMIQGDAGNPVGDVIRSMLRFCLVSTIIGNAGMFQQFVSHPALVDIPNGVAQAISGSIGGQPVNGGAQFDDIWNHAETAGLVVYKNLPSVSIKGALLCLAVFAYWAAAAVTVAIGFIIFLASHVLMSLLIAIGPLFVASALVPATRSWFQGWLNTVVGVIVAQVLVVGLMSLMIRVQTTELQRIASQPAGANEVGQVLGLLGVAILLGICAILAKQIPSFALSIGHGAYHNLHSYVSAAGSALSRAGSAAATAARASTLGNFSTATASAGAGQRTASFATASVGGQYRP